MPIGSSLAHGNGLCLLSFDAGGTRGISQLKILAETMHRMNFGKNDDNLDRPCSVFDMIGGVGSGGLIAILLVIFGLTVEEALDEFIALSTNVLDKLEMDAQVRTDVLKDHVYSLLKKYAIDSNTRLLDPNDHSQGCKLAIPISYKRHMESTCILRNYLVRQEQPLNLTVAEALLATLATPPLFASISIIKDSGIFEYIGAEMALSNPTEEIIVEAHGAFGADKRVACILSLGCGHPGVFDLVESSKLLDLIRLLEILIIDAQRKAQNLESRMGDLGIYHRFSVISGLERENSVTLLEPGDIITHTKAYLDNVPISRRLDNCIDLLRARDGASSLEQLKSSGGKTVLSPRLPPVTKTFVMRKEPWAFINKVILRPRESQDMDEPRMLIVTGIGGCGKTQMMLNFMKVHRVQFASLFFIDGSNEDRIRTDIIRNVRALESEHSQKGFDDCLLFLSQPSEDGVRLLLYDNVDDPNLDLLSFLPQGASCAIAITSRNRILGDLYPDSHLSLDVMTTNEAIELLPHRSESFADQARKEAIELAQALGCLPIALQQARSYMLQTKCSIKDYLLRLSSSRSKLLGQKIKHQIDMQAISTYAAFETSFERLTTHAKKLLWLLVHFHWSGFPLELIMLAAKHNFEYQRIRANHGNKFYVGKKMLEDVIFLDGKWEVTRLDEMILSLQSYSLVTVLPGIDTALLQMHPLMHEWLLSSIPKDETSIYQDAAVLLLALGACRDHTATMQHLSSHVLHLRSLWDQLSINDAAAFGTILYENGLFKGALHLQEAVTRQLKNETVPDNIEISNSIVELAATHWASGRLNMAAAFQQEVMNLNKSTLGERHANTIAATNDLALTYRDLGLLHEARVLQEDVVKLRKDILGERHPDTLTASFNLSITYRFLGILREAQVLQEDLLKLRKEILGNRHPDTISTSNNLALTYSNLGLLSKAKVIQEDVLRLRKEILGNRHPETIRTSCNLSNTYRNLGLLSEAQVLQEDAVKLRKDILGEQHYDTVRASSYLALTYVEFGRLKEARVLQEKALKFGRELVGDRHPSIIDGFVEMAATYRELGLLGEAEVLQVKALTVGKDLLGTMHPATIDASHELAITHRDQCRLEEALVAMEKVLKSRKEIQGENHPRTICASSDLATVFHRLGRLNEAEPLATEVVRLRIEKFGGRHPDTLIASRNLASIYCDLNRLEEAEALQLETLTTMQEVLGERHYKTTSAMLVLAHIYVSCRRKAEALELLTKAETIISDVLGTAHPQYLEYQKLQEEALNLNNSVQILQEETQSNLEPDASKPRVKRRSKVWLKIRKIFARPRK